MKPGAVLGHEGVGIVEEVGPDVRNIRRHLLSLTARQRRTIVDQIDQQLQRQPTVETRKRMRPNELAPWELRIGNFRVCYDVDEESAVATIVAAGVKRGHQVLIEGKEFRL